MKNGEKPCRAKITLTSDEWQQIAHLGERIVPGLKKGQKPSRSLTISTMLSSLR